jgi:hypothetical protein
MHSMEPRERELALEVLSLAAEHVVERTSGSILAAIREEASQLPGRYADVSDDFAEHVGAAAVWYLDRATRRVGDPDRDGLTPAQRAVNLARFNADADAAELQRLFAVAVALNAEDV